MKKKIIPSIFVLLLITLPYILAACDKGNETVFGGFLINPKDGNSYLAKMRQGYEGDWLFHLPFTAEEGRGQPLFLFYLFLGHAANWLHLPLLWMFHLARVCAAVFLLWALGVLSMRLFPDSERNQNLFFLISSLGSGMGWLISGFGILTSDLWVAEAYPFLSMYVNPHFPLGLGLMILLLIYISEGHPWKNWIRIIFLGLALSIILPFGIVIVGVVSVINWLWGCFRKKELVLPVNELSILPGFAWVGVQYIITINDPILKIWNEQNITPSPEVWDWVISFSPVIFIMSISLIKDRGEKFSEVWRTMLTWSAVATIIQAIPIGLQRRFLVGYYIPLAAFSIRALFLLRSKLRTRLVPLFIGISIPTNILLLFLAFLSAQTQPPALYLSNVEKQSYDWIIKNLEPDAIILCSPETGLRIPGWTGRKVVFGHEFETVHAAVREIEVENFFREPGTEASKLWAEVMGVDYIFIGPNENLLMNGQKTTMGREVYSESGYTILDISTP